MKLLTIVCSLLTFSALWGDEVDIARSHFEWLGTKVTGKHIGTIALKSGKLEFDQGKLKGGEFIMDMNSITNTDQTGEWREKLITHLKSSDFFDIQKFPESKLIVRKVEGDHVTADLTIKGKTNPVSFKVAKKDSEYSGILKFDRTKFDMIYGSGSFFKSLGDKMIHDEVVLNFKVVTK
ncbi:MAG: YceI family protein [Bdellovibrio sp.]|nr:YceI family protein [Bdellovibrio sp.]